MKRYNHYPILIVSDIDNKILKLKLTYYPSDDKYEEVSDILVMESHIAEALDYLLEHFKLIQKYTDNQITFEVSSLEILNNYRKSVIVRDIHSHVVEENFDVKINIGFTMRETEKSDFFSILKKFINNQEEEMLEKMVLELDLLSRLKRSEELNNKIMDLKIEGKDEYVKKKI